MSAVSGKSILDLLWEKLDKAVDQLMDTEKPGGWIADENPNAYNCDPAEIAREWEEWGGLRGHALGLAEAIACVDDPYSQDVDDVRAEAMARWQERHPD